jgi:hypothetical protein
MMQLFQETLFPYKLLVTVNLDSLQQFVLSLSEQGPTLFRNLSRQKQGYKKMQCLTKPEMPA